MRFVNYFYRCAFYWEETHFKDITELDLMNSHDSQTCELLVTVVPQMTVILYLCLNMF